MIIGYNVPDMTHLRYYVPLVTMTKRFFPNVEHEFVIGTTNNKYNSILRNNHKEILESVLKNLGNIVTKPSCIYDVLVTVEGYNTVASGAKFIAIQHGFDYRSCASGCPANATHIMTHEIYASELLSMYPSRDVIITDTPMTFWLEDEPQDEKSVFIFYPENGFHDIVCDVVTKLNDMDFAVTVKQRAKNQLIDSRTSEKSYTVYDKKWFPSESISIPAKSISCIGFGTSAYTDIAHAGIHFIDVQLPDYSKKYLKPKLSNFHSMDDTTQSEQIINAVLNAHKGSRVKNNPDNIRKTISNMFNLGE